MSLHWNAALFCSQLFFLRICLVVCHLKTHETDRSLHSAAVRAQTGSFGSLRNPYEQGTRDETRTAIEDVGTNDVLSNRRYESSRVACNTTH